MGYPKQLVEYEGEPLVRRAARNALSAGAERVVVVTGARGAEVAMALSEMFGVSTCLNQDWESGLSSSLRVGLREVELDGQTDGALILLCDQPAISVGNLERLIAAFHESPKIVASAYNDLIGVPVVVHRDFFAELSSLPGDSGAGPWLRDHPDLVTPIPMPAASTDIDTDDDVQKLRSTD